MSHAHVAFNRRFKVRSEINLPMGGCVGPYVCRACIIKSIDSILLYSFLFASKLALSGKK
jgi:hypothetical protein